MEPKFILLTIAIAIIIVIVTVFLNKKYGRKNQKTTFLNLTLIELILILLSFATWIILLILNDTVSDKTKFIVSIACAIVFISITIIGKRRMKKN